MLAIELVQARYIERKRVRGDASSVKLNLTDPCHTVQYRASTTVEGCQAGGLGHLRLTYCSICGTMGKTNFDHLGGPTKIRNQTEFQIFVFGNCSLKKIEHICKFSKNLQGLCDLLKMKTWKIKSRQFSGIGLIKIYLISRNVPNFKILKQSSKSLHPNEYSMCGLSRLQNNVQ